MTWIDLIYLVSAVLFILGLKKLSSPATARGGNFLSMGGMALAIGVTLLKGGVVRYDLLLAGLAVGAAIGVVSALKVKMTSMPEMVALFNGCGGAASALVAFSEYTRRAPGLETVVLVTIMLSVVIGTVTFSGSLVAFGKLQGIIRGRPIVFTGQQVVNLVLWLAVLGLGAWLYRMPGQSEALLIVVGLALLLGILQVIPIGGADMPVVIALLNAYSGVAASMTGFVLSNSALIVVGCLVGASGLFLTRLMCEAMNRSLTNVLFGAFGAVVTEEPAVTSVHGTVKEYTVGDAVTVMENASSLIIVPGYGMAVSRAQFAVRELADLLAELGGEVRYAIHPVAGRMPGHMNVLLAEADVSYDLLFAMEDINDDFPKTDVALVVGANDVVNPAAKNTPESPLYGMPILNVDEAKTVIVLKRSMRPGFAGVENELFYHENTMMVFGDAKTTLEKVIRRLKD